MSAAAAAESPACLRRRAGCGRRPRRRGRRSFFAAHLVGKPAGKPRFAARWRMKACSVRRREIENCLAGTIKVIEMAYHQSTPTHRRGSGPETPSDSERDRDLLASRIGLPGAQTQSGICCLLSPIDKSQTPARSCPLTGSVAACPPAPASKPPARTRPRQPCRQHIFRTRKTFRDCNRMPAPETRAHPVS